MPPSEATSLRRDLLAACKRRGDRGELLRICHQLQVDVPASVDDDVDGLCAHLDKTLRKRWQGATDRAYSELAAAMEVPPEAAASYSVLARPRATHRHSQAGGAPTMEERLAVYERVRQALKGGDDQALCGLHGPFVKVKRIGTPSAYGKVYLVEHKATRIRMAAKVMAKTAPHMREAKHYEDLEGLVLERKTPHMPLVFKARVCDLCEKDIIATVPTKKCVVLLSELGDGDFRSWLEAKKRSALEVFSFIGQIMMGLHVLELKGLKHNDFHWGQQLYQEQPSLKGQYLAYKIEGHDVFVLHTGFLWTLWDFGMMKKVKGAREAVRTDLYRILHFPKWAQSKGYPRIPLAPGTASIMTDIAATRPGMSVWACLKAFDDLWKQSRLQSSRDAWSRAIVIDPDSHWRSKARILPGIYQVG